MAFGRARLGLGLGARLFVGVNADGGREVLGLDIASDEDGAGWLAFLRSLRPRPVRGEACRLRRPPRPRRRDRRRPARRRVAALPHPLAPQPADQGPEIGPAPGSRPSSARCSTSPTPTPSEPSTTERSPRSPRSVPRGRRSPRRRPRGTPGLHRLPPGDLAPDLLQQPPGTTRQGDPPPHRRRRDLPQPRRDHSPRRRGPGRTDHASRRDPTAACTNSQLGGRPLSPHRPRRAGDRLDPPIKRTFGLRPHPGGAQVAFSLHDHENSRWTNWTLA